MTIAGVATRNGRTAAIPPTATIAATVAGRPVRDGQADRLRASMTIGASRPFVDVRLMAAVASLLRSHKPVSMFSTHYVIVQVCDPLSAASGQIEVSRRLAKMHRHAVPIEPRIFFDEIGGRRIP